MKYSSEPSTDRAARRFLLVLVPVLVLAAGCATTKEAGHPPPAASPAPVPETKARTPDISFTVASLDMAGVQRRIEKPDISAFAAALAKEKVEILTLQNVVRYPGVATRVDVLDELSGAAEMQNTFGEITDNAGRQTGNAVLSSYTIRSSNHTPYAGLRSDAEASHAVIDCGAREIVAVSTGVPAKPTPSEAETCLRTLSELPRQYGGHPMMIAGNLQALGRQPSEEYQVVRGGSETPVIWYSSGGAFVLQSQRVVRTPFGPMLIARFGLFRQ